MLYSPMIAPMRVSNVPAPANGGEAIDWFQLVRDSVKGLRFGVVQIETTEKVRVETAH